MKLIDTTDKRAEAGVRTLISYSDLERDAWLEANFRIRMKGMYAATVGDEWDSHGRQESDFLHHIELPLRGARSIVHRNRVFDLNPGDVWFLPGNTPVERRCSCKCEVLFLKFCCEWLPGVDPLLDWQERGPRRIGTFEMKDWMPWNAAGRKFSMVDLLHLKGSVLTWMTKAVPELGAVVSSHLATHLQFSKAFALIESKLGADLRLAALADAQGVSVDAFSTAFSRNIGIGPKEYLSRRINEKALAMVTHTDMKMKEIADALRFTDEFYFSRFFKKMNGLPPSAYRAVMRKPIL